MCECICECICRVDLKQLLAKASPKPEFHLPPIDEISVFFSKDCADVGGIEGVEASWKSVYPQVVLSWEGGSFIVGTNPSGSKPDDFPRFTQTILILL